MFECNRKRFMESRIVRDNLSISTSLNVYNEIKGASYVVVSADHRLRNQPVYRIMDTVIGKDLQIEATGAGIEELRYRIRPEFNTDLYERDARRIAGVTTALIGEGWLYSFSDGIREKTTLERIGGGSVYDAVIELANDLDADVEVTYHFNKGETVARKVVRFYDDIGKDVTSGIVYGINATTFSLKEYRAEVYTAVEAYGREDENGNRLDLSSLEGRSYTLANGNRATVREMPSGGYGLEDTKLTRENGIYNLSTQKVEPKVELMENGGIEKINDLLSEAKRALLNATANIEITVDGTNIQADVGDRLPVQHHELGIDVTLDILEIDENMLVEDDMRYKVGVRKKYEFDKDFGDLMNNIGTGSGVRQGTGAIRTTIILPTNLVYTGNNERGSRIKWTEKTTRDMTPLRYVYKLEFDYHINSSLQPAYIQLGYVNAIAYLANNYQSYGNHNKGFSERAGKIAEIPITSNSGSVEILLNDYYDFMDLHNKINETQIGVDELGNYTIRHGTYLFPYIFVYNDVGELVTVNWLDYKKPHPETQADLSTLSGYITNFRLTEHVPD